MKCPETIAINNSTPSCISTVKPTKIVLNKNGVFTKGGEKLYPLPFKPDNSEMGVRKFVFDGPVIKSKN